MKRLLILPIILSILVACVYIEQTKQDHKLLPEFAAREKVKKQDQYHYTGKYCSDCHEQTPQRGGSRYLKDNGDYNLLCKCHLKTPDSYIHPTGVFPSDEKKTKIPADFPLEEGKLTCLTCHDIYRMCQRRVVDRFSLRGAPYQRKTDLCFKCHNKESYEKLNPHTQLEANGDIKVKVCLFCHTEKPDELRARFKDVKFYGDLTMLCQRCHMIRGNHSGNFNHLIKPSPVTLANMKLMEEKFGIILPLAADGRMTCVTCHNPHQKGVIPPERAAAKGADSKFRHRLPGRMCIECHIDKMG
jgi:hypothetical protein